jgi:hypothetical protein
MLISKRSDSNWHVFTDFLIDFYVISVQDCCGESTIPTEVWIYLACAKMRRTTTISWRRISALFCCFLCIVRLLTNGCALSALSEIKTRQSLISRRCRTARVQCINVQLLLECQTGSQGTSPANSGHSRGFTEQKKKQQSCWQSGQSRQEDNN